MRSPSIVACLGVLIVVAMAFLASAAGAEERLENGGFEGGTAGWALLNAFTTGCDAHGGVVALRLSPADGAPARARRTFAGPFDLGTYTLSAWLKLTSGSATIELTLTWLDAAGDTIKSSTWGPTPGADYGKFEGTTSVPAIAASVSIDVVVRSTGSATVCLDDLSLDGPPPPAPTPTDTPIPTSSSTAQATASPTPASTRTPTATPTRTPAPGLVFINGGFEDGTRGWQKFGGELQTTESPRMSGLAAGYLSSATSSTKWAYQTVVVDPGQHYEFSGYLRPAGNASKAYLRVSWYATPDGSGEAIGSADSTVELSGPSSQFTWLTTGPVQPPSGAKTAKPRVVLTPDGAAPAGLFMDDLAFALATPATPTPVAPTSTPPPTSTPAGPATPQATATTNDVAGMQTEPPPTATQPSVLSEVSSIRAVAPTAAPAARSAQQSEAGSAKGVPLTWLLGAGALVAGLGGMWWQGHRSRLVRGEKPNL